MSLEIVRFAASHDRPEIRVIVAITEAERAAVYALRHAIYVREMGLLPEDHPFVHGQSLRDAWDDRSIQLLALVGDEPVGTIRLTPAASGPLELEQYRPLDLTPAERAVSCEGTRFMVKRAWRRSLVGGALLLATARAMAQAGLTVLWGAGKQGSLGRYYQCFGMKRVGDDTFTYDLVGSARYALLRLDIGRPWSLARARLNAFIAFACTAAVTLGRREWVVGRRAARPLGAATQPA